MKKNHYILVVNHNMQDIVYDLFSDPDAVATYQAVQGYYEPIADTVLRYKKANPGSFPWLDGMTQCEVKDLDQSEIFRPDYSFSSAADLVAFAVDSGAVIDKEHYYIIC